MRKKNTECIIDQIVLEGMEGVDGQAIGPLVHHHLNRMAGPLGFSSSQKGQIELGNLSLELDEGADENTIGLAIAEAIYSQLQ